VVTTTLCSPQDENPLSYDRLNGEWGDYSGLGVAASLECKLLYEEAKTTYVSGTFVATILLCQAFVEHWLTQFLDEEGSGRQIPRNLDGLLKVCRKEGLMHDYDLPPVVLPVVTSSTLATRSQEPAAGIPGRYEDVAYYILYATVLSTP
jgi:hypothetical protein